MTGSPRAVEPAISGILIDRQRIADRVAGLAGELGAELQRLDGSPLIVMPILTGSIIFVADLIRQLPGRFRVEVVSSRSYHGASTRTSGRPVIGEMPAMVRGAHVLIVDDILDSGTTLACVRERVAASGATSTRACVLLRKRTPAAMRTPCEHVGFDVDDVFVVGYGLDFDGYYRNLPDIAVLEVGR